MICTIGLGVIAAARTGERVYLLVSSGYFVLTALHRLMCLYQKICTVACFPSTFVTSVQPVYLRLIFAAKLIMPD